MTSIDLLLPTPDYSGDPIEAAVYDSGTLTVNLGDPNADASAVGRFPLMALTF